MSRARVLAPLLTVLALMAGALGAAPAHAVDGPVRILLSGDSLTQGFHGDYTWRFRLAQEFARQAVPVDFVGSDHSTNVRSPWTDADYADPRFDSDHFALVGTSLAQRADGIRAEVFEQRPDVVLIAAGVNDLRWGIAPADVDASLRAFIRNARAARPDVRLVVSPVLQARDTTRTWLPEAISAFDALERDTVAELSTAESPVVLADTNRGWNAASMTYDGLHPTPTGETLIAQRVAETMRALGLLTSAPSVYRTVAWPHVAPLTAVRSGLRVGLSWRQQATTGTRIAVRRVGTTAWTITWVKGGLGAWTSTALVPGQAYDFRSMVFRGTMSGPWGPSVRVRVPGTAAPAPVARVSVTRSRISWTRSAGATRYLVKYQRRGSSRWVSKRTTGLAIGATRVARARVWAENAGGRSAARVGLG